MVPPLLLSVLLAFQWSASPANSFAPPSANIRRESVAVAASAREVDLCIIGGGISGLAAAITAAQQPSSSSTQQQPSILLLESDSAAVGGRVRSDVTEDGFILDRGFAVFIEEYPESKNILDYDALGLGQFWPGAKVKLAGRDKLASVSDPLRRPGDVFTAIASPVGSPLDKLRLIPLFYCVMTKSIEDLFQMDETDTLTCLRDQYRFSDEFISSFFAPFLEGIYLTSLENQSSRMFHFVMKMFTVGSTALPRGGMQAAANQLEIKAKGLGVEVQLGSRALSLKPRDNGESPEKYVVEVDSNEHGKQMVHAKSVIVATDANVAGRLLNGIDDLEQRAESLAKTPQRSVGCLYYGFRSPAPLSDPILILNGEGGQRRGTKAFPVNNVCFPSVVQRSYAPDGYDLCSVSILENALAEHDGDLASLDKSVREQLSTWFTDYANDIRDETKWIQKGVYVINNAQPAHYGGARSANVHGGRDCSIDDGVFVCGDHMATSTFNGALESGVNAGNAAGRFIAES